MTLKVIFGFFIVMLVADQTYFRQKREDDNKTLESYIKTQQCEHIGFAGRDPQKYYRCKDGVYLRSELFTRIRK